MSHPFELELSALEVVWNLHNFSFDNKSSHSSSETSFSSEDKGEENIFTTLALGEEGGTVTNEVDDEEIEVTTLALGEEGGTIVNEVDYEEIEITTLALGEEGGTVFTEVEGEEGGIFTTQAIGEEGGTFTTQVDGEGVDVTTLALGEEGGVTTQAVGEEGGVTTLAIGEEGGNYFIAFDEGFYLNNYPDVKAAVEAKIFSSGFEHFQLFGLLEKRSLTSPSFDEQFYLRRYVDVAEAVSEGLFSSALSHFLIHGLVEGRLPTGFNDLAYLLLSPDVAIAVANGVFASGLDHYAKHGQFEDRSPIFNGTGGNDIVIGFGKYSTLAGVSLDFVAPIDEPYFRVNSTGLNEVDFLIGGSSGTDRFLLGVSGNLSLPDVTPQDFYVGGGSADYGVIRNFDVKRDRIDLAKGIADYKLATIDGDTRIYTVAGDLIGIVEGVTSLYISETNTFNGNITIVTG
ncbi:MAG TPA: hypothetical protein V6D28_07670 [Leptolyngbyaceae cyanobacterium]